MHNTIIRLFLLSLTAASVFRIAKGNNAAEDDDDRAVADEAYASDNNNNNGNYNFYYDEGVDYIQYWTDYAIQPKRCVVYNNVDVVIFSLFENQYNQCMDDSVGTYYVPVPTFVQGFMDQKEQDMNDQGINDYAVPDVAQYIYCTPFVIAGQYRYLQVGCADDTVLGLAINIYVDKDCTTRSEENGYDDSTIDVTEIHPTFKKCRACVNWFDREDGADVDDMFYENRKKVAPLCQTAWTNKQECNRKCQRLGVEKTNIGEGWTPSDKVLLAILSVFGLILIGLIINKRQKMSNKDTLLEQAALSTAGLQQPHVIGMFILIVLVIATFALLGLKNITWGLFLVINTALFAYLMKLTVRSNEPIVGPNGEIMRQDSDDSSLISDSEDNDGADDPVKKNNQYNPSGTYVLPTIA